jgi:RND family efflux transporter MFP subunit
MPKFYRWVLIATIALPLLAACGKQQDQAQGPGAGQMPPPPVTVATPLVKDIIEWDDFSGRFEAVDKVDVRARVGGYLKSTHFKEGDFVKKGDLLFTIDQRPYQAALRQAEAAVANTQARLEFTTSEVGRAKNLRERGNVPERILEQRIQEQRQAAADLSSAKGALDQAKLNMEFSEVRAPIGGRISSNFVTEGNLITGGTADSTLLTTIVSLSPIHFVFDIDEQAYIKYSRLARIGDRPSGRDNANPVFVSLADEANFRHRGRMDFVDNRIDNNTGTMRGRAIFDNEDKFLTPGQFGRIRVLGSGKYQAVLIPDSAIATDQSRKLVLTVGENNIVKSVPVTPGPLVDGLRIIRQGLTGSEKIVINGLQRAQDGAPVTPEPGEIKATANDIQPELLEMIQTTEPTVTPDKLSPEDVSYATHNEDLMKPSAPPRDNAAPTVKPTPIAGDEQVKSPAPEALPGAKPNPNPKMPREAKVPPKLSKTTETWTPAVPADEVVATPPAAEVPITPPVAPSPETPAPVDSSHGNKPMSAVAPETPAAAPVAPVTVTEPAPAAPVATPDAGYITGGEAPSGALPSTAEPNVIPAEPRVERPPTLAPDQDQPADIPARPAR